MIKITNKQIRSINENNKRKIENICSVICNYNVYKKKKKTILLLCWQSTSISTSPLKVGD